MSKSIVRSITDIEVAKEKAYQAARKILDEKHVHGLPTNPRHIAETYDIQVSTQILDEGIFGVLAANKDRASIGINRTYGPMRQNFIIAHLFGHFIMHVPKNGSPSVYVEYDHNLSDPAGDTRSQELQANAFAMELMIPKEALDVYLNTFNVRHNNINQLQKTADHFGVEITLLIARMIDCKYQPY